MQEAVFEKGRNLMEISLTFIRCSEEEHLINDFWLKGIFDWENI
jgi:hypothetical protein